jgi:segregation and condensation protein A
VRLFLEPVKIRLDNFEGPYDLLLSLLEKNKLEITEISITEIADQYIEYISSAGGFDLDIASEFLVMGATLIHMKSKRLLPKPEEEEEELTAEELARRLSLYKSIKQASYTLEKDMEFWSQCLYKKPEELNFPRREEILDLNIFELSNCMTILQQRLKDRRQDTSKKMEQILEREKVSLKDMMVRVVNVITKKTRTRFSELFSLKRHSKTEVVTGFLAILELDKGKKIKLQQEKLFDEIDIYLNNNGNDNNLEEFLNSYDDIDM